MKIHKTSVVNKNAQIDKDVEIGAFCIIDNDVKIGSGTKIMPYVHILPYTTIGENNIIHQGSTIGGVPQDLKFDNEKTELIIGDNNIKPKIQRLSVQKFTPLKNFLCFKVTIQLYL